MILSFLQELGCGEFLEFCHPVEGDDNRGYRFKCNLSLPEFWLEHHSKINEWCLNSWNLYPLQFNVDEVDEGVNPAPHLEEEA